MSCVVIFKCDKCLDTKEDDESFLFDVLLKLRQYDDTCHRAQLCRDCTMELAEVFDNFIKPNSA
jgi:hypothetical protein